MSCRALEWDEVVTRIDVVPEEIPLYGNACDTGDEELDRQVEQEILARLERDDVWAWATVAVTVSWGGQDATEYLGCCSYENEVAFRKCDYFSSMAEVALNKLNQDLHNLYQRLSVDHEI